MVATLNAGIDYGSGRSNIDHATGIRYGVISQHSITQAWADNAQPEYGKPTCPECGEELVEFDESKHGEWEGGRGCNDYACKSCEGIYDSCDAFGEEPIAWHYEGDGYKLTDCLDSDVMVLASPFYTFAVFCSPCVPGAGDLNNPVEDGVKTYCLGHDWFDEGRAPYPVYSVEDRPAYSIETGVEVLP